MTNKLQLSAPNAFATILERASAAGITMEEQEGGDALLRLGSRSVHLRWVYDDGGTTYATFYEERQGTTRRGSSSIYNACLYETYFNGNGSVAALLAYLIAELEN